MTYTVKEIFYTLQGEGGQAGRAAVFLRFAGCNLWSGREEDRSIAVCRFCDTDFVGGEKFADAEDLAHSVESAWAPAAGPRLVVCTGGEPLLQLDGALVSALHRRNFEVAVETNGTQAAPTEIDWMCVSPKAGASLKTRRGNELKLVFPQPGAMPDQFAGLDFDRFSLQPMDGLLLEQNTADAIAYCMQHPQWRLSLQTHKTLGIR